MQKKYFINGLMLGFAGAFLYKTYKNRKVILTSEKVLEIVKDTCRQNFQMSDSWILDVPQTMEGNPHMLTVYQGGFTSLTEHTSKEFLANAYTGEILEIWENEHHSS